jgi:hypothetical protein
MEISVRIRKLEDHPTFPRFGKWTALEDTGLQVVGYKDGRPSRRRHWLCVCDCGRRRSVIAGTLSSGHSKSCGYCKDNNSYKHGHSGKRNGKKASPEYKVWATIKKRAREDGVPFHEPWNEFGVFIADLGLRPSLCHQLCRKDLAKGYTPKNLRWKKRRKIKPVTYNGYTGSAHSIARQLDIPPSRIYNRLRAGEKVDVAIEAAPVKKIKVTFDGKSLTLKEWEQEVGIPYEVLRRRHSMKWPPRKMLMEPVSEKRNVTYLGEPFVLMSLNEDGSVSYITIHRDQTLSLMEWSKVLDVPYTSLCNRWMRNEPFDKILHAGNRRKPELYLTLNEETKSIADWFRFLGINKTTLARRKKHGWSDERTLTEPVDPSKRTKKAVDYGKSTVGPGVELLGGSSSTDLP